MAVTMIEMENLACLSGKKYLLKDINWRVEKGEHWVVFGMNGCGKTTLLSIIAGFKKYTHGSLKVFGETYTNDNILSLRRRIGLVSGSFFERYYTKESALHIVLSGKSGTFGLEGGIMDKDVRLAKALLQELHLAELINQPFDWMSRGEKQNVLIARALFAHPEILLLDEPCTGLDVANREHLLNTVRDLAEKTGITIIYVTHYPDEILAIFQHTLLLRNGHVYTQGVTEEAFSQENMGAFLQYPASVDYHPGAIEVKMDVRSNVLALLEEVDDHGQFL